jgi:type II secretory pathway component PulF
LVTCKYTAISKGGQRVSGVVEAFDRMDAVDRIKRECDIVLKAEKTTDKKLHRILTQVADDVEGGRSLAAAFDTII